jgi:cobalt/nickel transport system ATP-binding protein
MNASPLFRLQGVHFSFGDGREVLAGVDFSLDAGERVAVLGANGAGKTTLLQIMVGLLRPDAGEVVAFGRTRRSEDDFHQVRARAGLLFQDPDDQLFCPTVAEDVAFGPLNLGRSRAQAAATVERTLAALGLSGLADRITHRLSGGEKRLVSLAAVLAMEPEVLLLDEPTNALDEAAAARLTGILKALPQAMIIVSHDRAFRASLASRAVTLQGGRIEPASV